MARQLILDLPVTAAFGAEDYLVGASNERAFSLIDGWPRWPDRLLLLVGPEGSGKSHLATIWASRAGAETVAARHIASADVPRLAEQASVVVEDLHRGPVDEGALFHLFNLARERRHDVLVSSARPASALGLRTPDLLSRLRLAPFVELDPPDDGLLRAVLVKLFHDRQITVDAPVVDYVASRIERSFAAASRIVSRLDDEAMSRGRRVTRPMAAAILAEDGDGEDEASERHRPVISGS